jgi:GT2 family glycosyltransferase
LDAAGHDDRLTGRHYPTIWSEFSDWMGFRRHFPANRFPASSGRPNHGRGITASVPLLSGACLLLSAHLPADLRRLNADYRMYGEDLDLSRRVQAAGFETVLLAESVVIHLGGQSSQQARCETALLAIDAANRYFRQWHGSGVARRHRLLMAVVALVKGVAFSLLQAAGLEADAAEKRRFYKTLLRWSWHGDFREPPTPQPRISPHLE